MTITYHAGRRIQGLSTEKPTDTPYDKHAGTTFVGLNGTGVQGFGNKVFSGFELIGTTITKIGFYMKTAGSGTIQFGIWNSSSGLKLEFGTKSAATLTSTETLYEFENLTGVILEVGDYIGWRLASGDSSPTCSRYNDGTGASPYLYGSYIGSSAIWQDAGDNQDMNMKLTPKALNIQLGSRFEETDTRKMYFFKDPLVFEDDFTSYADQASADAIYPSNDTAKARVNITTDLINFNSVLDSTNDSISRDYTTVSDTLWVMRFHLIVSSVTVTAGDEVFINIGMSSVDYATARASAQDSISLNLFCDNLTRTYRIQHGDGASMGANNTNFTETVTAGDDYYIELKRTSATNVDVNIYSNSAFTTLVETKSATVASTIAGLRYFVIRNGAHTTASGSIVITLDDIKFYNGVTTISKTWSEEA